MARNAVTQHSLCLVVLVVALLGCDSDKSERDARRAQRRVVNEARLTKGPIVEWTKRISAEEEISILIVPQGRGDPLDDKRCVIYRHLEYKAASISCESEGTALP